MLTVDIEMLVEKCGIPVEIGKVIISCYVEDFKKIKKVLSKLSHRIEYIQNVDKMMMLPKGINKGRGLEMALNHLDIDGEKTIIVRDGENDKDMFNIPGFKVALANANPLLKKLANQVTESSYYNGVIEIINKLKQ